MENVRTKFTKVLAILMVLGLCIVALGTCDQTSRPALAAYGDCLAYDTYSRSNGAPGSTETDGPGDQVCPELSWTGSGASISSNKLIIEPSKGSEMVSDTTFDDPDDWDDDAGVNGWTVADGVATHGTDTYAGSMTNTSGTSSSTYTWYWLTIDRNVTSAGSYYAGIGNVAIIIPWATGSGTIFGSVRNGYNTSKPNLYGSRYLAATGDNLSIKPITFTTMFAVVNSGDPDVIASANLVLTAQTQAGIIANLDNTTTPSNYILAYHDGTNVYLVKVVSGTPTQLIGTAATYSSGATLQLETYHSGSNLLVRVKYNGNYIGSQQTISDSGIVDNTRMGVFSTYSSNTIDDFYVTENDAPTATPTNTNTHTQTSTYTPTNTFTETLTYTNTYTPTNTFTETNTPTETYTPTLTFTHTPTFTNTVPTATSTDTSTPTETYTPTITDTPSLTPTGPTPTFTLTFTPTPLYYLDNRFNFGDLSVGALLIGGGVCLGVVLILVWVLWMVNQKRGMTGK